MQRTLCYLLVTLAGCAGTQQSDPDRPVRSACSGMSCFRERDIRDVQLLDDDTLVVFVGPQRCAFRMELQGPYCGYVSFSLDFDLDARNQLLGGSTQPRICTNDRPYINDPFARSAEGVMPGGRGPRPSGVDSFDRCRVAQIIPLTDDELMEAYVETGVQAPLPPVGSGEVSVEEARTEEEISTEGMGAGPLGGADPQGNESEPGEAEREQPGPTTIGDDGAASEP
jgi:hypothetical protein